VFFPHDELVGDVRAPALRTGDRMEGSAGQRRRTAAATREISDYLTDRAKSEESRFSA